MSSARRRSRPLNLSLCLMAASVIGACGGGGDPSTPVSPLEASTEGRTAIASAFASSDSVDHASDFALQAVPNESASSVNISNNGEMASGSAGDIGLPDTPNDLSTLPAASAGPLSMSNPLLTPTSSHLTETTVGSVATATTTPTPKISTAGALSPTAPSVTSTGSASLAWKLPTTRADGSAIGALSGYRIYYGTSSGTYSSTVFISGGSKVAGIVTGLGKGTWYFAVATVDASGNESGFGYEMSKSL